MRRSTKHPAIALASTLMLFAPAVLAAAPEYDLGEMLKATPSRQTSRVRMEAGALPESDASSSEKFVLGVRNRSDRKRSTSSTAIGAGANIPAEEQSSALATPYGSEPDYGIGEWWDGNRFHCVLVDAPCSGTGVIRRHPDIKHLRRPGDIGILAGRQKVLLERLWQTLSPGGYLLYITCSVLAEENEQQIERFTHGIKNSAVRTVPLPVGIRGRYGVQTLPGVHNVDGFYYSLLQKTGI